MELADLVTPTPGRTLAAQLGPRFDGGAVIAGRSAIDGGLVAELKADRPDLAVVVRRGRVPDRDEVRKLLGILRKVRPDLDGVVAVGGGVTIDTTKLVAAFWSDPVLLDTFSEGDPLPAMGPAVAAIPTTAGSGSEATPFAAMYCDGVKQSADTPRLRPVAVALAPDACAAPRPEAASAAAADALAQSLESIWSRSATWDSSQLAHVAFSRVWAATEGGMPTSDAAWADLCIGAHIAGRAIATSRTTAAHALSYRLTSRYGIRHGQAVAMFLPSLLALNLHDPNRRWRLPEVLGEDPCRAAEQLADHFDATGVSPSPYAAGLRDPALADDIVGSVNPDRLSRNPRVLCAGSLHALMAHQLSPSWRAYGDVIVHVEQEDCVHG